MWKMNSDSVKQNFLLLYILSVLWNGKKHHHSFYEFSISNLTSVSTHLFYRITLLFLINSPLSLNSLSISFSYFFV